MELTALSAAKRITQLADEHEIKDLSPLKLQKILYFIEGNLLANDSVTSFFPETPEAWKFGPVYVDIYEKFKNKQYGEPILESDFETTLSTDFNNEIDTIIKMVWDKYKDKTASELVTVTHRTDPWIIAKNYGYGSRISKEDMREYFSQNDHE